MNSGDTDSSVTDDAARVPATQPNRRRFIIAASFVAMGALAAGLALHRRGRATKRDGSAILAMSLPDLQGREQPLAQWRGKVLVVNFWATWCTPCREEMPHFIAVQNREGGKGVQFVGIAVDQADKVREFVKEIGVNYPVLIGGFGAIELSKTLGNELAALPFTVVVDRRGDIAHTQLGPLKAAQLDDLLRELLGRA